MLKSIRKFTVKIRWLFIAVHHHAYIWHSCMIAHQLTENSFAELVVISKNIAAQATEVYACLNKAHHKLAHILARIQQALAASSDPDKYLVWAVAATAFFVFFPSW